MLLKTWADSIPGRADAKGLAGAIRPCPLPLIEALTIRRRPMHAPSLSPCAAQRVGGVDARHDVVFLRNSPCPGGPACDRRRVGCDARWDHRSSAADPGCTECLAPEPIRNKACTGRPRDLELKSYAILESHPERNGSIRACMLAARMTASVDRLLPRAVCGGNRGEEWRGPHGRRSAVSREPRHTPSTFRLRNGTVGSA